MINIIPRNEFSHIQAVQFSNIEPTKDCTFATVFSIQMGKDSIHKSFENFFI